MKRLLSIILTLTLLCTAGAAFAEGPGRSGGRGGNGGMRGGAGGSVDKSGDAELQAMIADVVPKYQLLTFEDAETGTSLQYYLCIPENYDETQSYPLLQFIPDSSVVGKETSAYLTQGWGGLIWATEEEQAKHLTPVTAIPFRLCVQNTVSAEAGAAKEKNEAHSVGGK